MLENYAAFLDALRTGTNFSLARYGDGEFFAIFKASGHNCDGHVYFESLGEALKETLLRPHDAPYFYGMVRIAQTTQGDTIDRFFIRRRIEIPWIDGTMLVDASRRGHLFPLIQILRKKKMLYVGPERLCVTPPLEFNYVSYITVPLLNSWLQVAEITTALYTAIEEQRPDIVGFSAGMMTNVIMHALYAIYADSLTVIDFGSLWDPFLGFNTRKYMRTKDWNQTLQRNLGYV